MESVEDLIGELKKVAPNRTLLDNMLQMVNKKRARRDEFPWGSWIKPLIQLSNNNYPLFEELINHFSIDLPKHQLLIRQSKLESIESSKLFSHVLQILGQSKIRCINHGFFLLNMIALYGSFPHLIKGIIKDFHQDLINEKDDCLPLFKAVFQTLFIRYETPEYLIDSFNELRSSELYILAHILSGKNLKRAPNLPIHVSSREAHLLQNYNPLKFLKVWFADNWANKNNQILYRNIIAAKIFTLIEPSSYGYAIDFLRNHRQWKYEPKKILENIFYWRNAILLCENRDGKILLRYRKEHVIDYLIYHKEVHPKFCIKNISISQLNAKINNWEKAIEKDTGKPIEWTSMGIAPYLAEDDQNKFSITEISNSFDLRIEGFKLKHCVFSYLNECKLGRSHIFSMRKQSLENSNWERHATIQVVGKSIAQIKSKSNSSIGQLEAEIIRDWADEHGLYFL